MTVPAEKERPTAVHPRGKGVASVSISPRERGVAYNCPSQRRQDVATASISPRERGVAYRCPSQKKKLWLLHQFFKLFALCHLMQIRCAWLFKGVYSTFTFVRNCIVFVNLMEV